MGHWALGTDLLGHRGTVESTVEPTVEPAVESTIESIVKSTFEFGSEPTIPHSCPKSDTQYCGPLRH